MVNGSNSLATFDTTKRELLQFFLLAILGYFFSFLFMFLLSSRLFTIGLVLVLLVLYNYFPKKVLFIPIYALEI